MAATDDELLNAAVAGDRDSLVALLERHASSVRHHLSGTIPQRHQGILSEDDVMQQTYADAFLAIGRFRSQGDGAFGGWLRTLARRNLLDALEMLDADKRGGGRHRVEAGKGDESFVELYEIVGATSSTPSRNVAGEEARRAIEQAMKELPDTYRKLIQLYDLEDKPVEEVAKALNRSTGAVYMLRARAHRKLRDIMGNASRFLSGS